MAARLRAIKKKEDCTLKKVWEWAKYTRPAASFLGFMVSLASFGVAYSRIDIIALISSFECFIFLCATMVVNDYVDRRHDAFAKGKDFALRNEKAFLWYAIALWSVEALMITKLWMIDYRLAVLALVRAVCGLLYSWTRFIPVLPALMVGLMSGLCCANAAVLQDANSIMWAFLVGTVFGLFARETLKDIEDSDADALDGWKKTIATVWGPDVARTVARSLLVISGLIFLSLPLSVLPALSASAGIACLSVMSISGLLIRGRFFGKAKLLLDSGMATFLLALNASYWILLMTPVGLMKLGKAGLPLVILLWLIFHLLLRKYRSMRMGLEVLDDVVSTSIDDGQERKRMPTRQSSAVWPIMYAVFWLIVCVSRVVSGCQVTGKSLVAIMPDALATSLVLTVILLFLVNGRTPHVSVTGRTRGYTIVERMSAGIPIGFFFCVLSTLGFPLWLVAILIPAATIVHPELLASRNLLKAHSCYLGILVSTGIVLGISYALKSVGIAYLVTVGFYYYWHWRYRLPVYIPQSGILNPVMSRLFVQEVTT